MDLNGPNESETTRCSFSVVAGAAMDRNGFCLTSLVCMSGGGLLCSFHLLEACGPGCESHAMSGVFRACVIKIPFKIRQHTRD